jgi:hypothetical protein
MLKGGFDVSGFNTDLSQSNSLVGLDLRCGSARGRRSLAGTEGEAELA